MSPNGMHQSIVSRMVAFILMFSMPLCMTGCRGMTSIDYMQNQWDQIIGPNGPTKTTYAIAKDEVSDYLRSLSLGQLESLVRELGPKVESSVFSEVPMSMDPDKEFLTFVAPLVGNECIHRGDANLIRSTLSHMPIAAMGTAAEFSLAETVQGPSGESGVDLMYESYEASSPGLIREQLEDTLSRVFDCELSSKAIADAYAEWRTMRFGLELDPTYRDAYRLWEQSLGDPPRKMFRTRPTR